MSVIGHADRAQPLRDYCAGLLLGERKSVEPLAAWTAAQHQALLHFADKRLVGRAIHQTYGSR